MRLTDPRCPRSLVGVVGILVAALNGRIRV